ncbi:MAG: dihydrofolate reductase [Flavobacteriales bacterium]|nr:dihydrofolate reductase [Flavobacteriales bacterium]|tara:strand:+ start:2133 stop:4142 length:2010 start_codon:yes stop_codon:yes gene_type:complete
MKKVLFIGALASMILSSCNPNEEMKAEETQDNFQWQVDRFADIKVLRYQIPSWDDLTPKQRIYAYHLNQAGLAGRDIMWDCNYRHNLEIRRALEAIISSEYVKKDNAEYAAVELYAKRVFFANGIHHHYSNMKFAAKFNQDWFITTLNEIDIELSQEAIKAIFDPSFDSKKVNRADGADLLLESAVNFYAPDVSQAEAEAFYANKVDADPARPVSHGLNSRLSRDENGQIYEEVFSARGRYANSIKEIIRHLSQAKAVSENEEQAIALGLLIEYYETGDLTKWDDYNIAWVGTTGGDVDYINGFVEVYNDPMGYRGSYETVVQVKDFDASARMAVVADNVQWFEDNSPIMDEHKKESVVGVSYKIVTVAGEAGDASPSTPIGVNLPNANWIRVEHGSKSVSLGNIEDAYQSSSGKGMMKEFGFSSIHNERSEKYGELGSKMHTALHEVVGHASGMINPGIGTPKQTLKNYSSTLEEARADLVALYFILDDKMQEIGLMENKEAGYAEYDSYISNGMMLQLRRILPGDDIEEDHMRNRQLVASWAFEQGMEENVIERKEIEGKTYFVINDYDKLKGYFGQLLREIQRIKSEGDFDAGRALVETYGVKVDQAIHAEVLSRSKPLNLAPYSGFVNPEMEPIFEQDSIVDVKVNYPMDFLGQMLRYGKHYSFE